MVRLTAEEQAMLDGARGAAVAKALDPIATGDRVRVDADAGEIHIWKADK